MAGMEIDLIHYLLRVFAHQHLKGRIEIDPAGGEAVVRLKLNDNGECPFVPEFVPAGAGDRPPAPADMGGATAAGCVADLLRLLRSAGRRLTTTQILSAAARDGLPWSESKIKGTLSAMVEAGIIFNHADGNPRGYEPAENAAK